jgi:hypothetical protein
VWLVHLEETASLFYDRLLITSGICNSFWGHPNPPPHLVLSDNLNIVFAHCALAGRGNISPRDDLIEQLLHS